MFKQKMSKKLGPLSMMLVDAAKRQGAKIKVVSPPATFWTIKGKKKWLFCGVYTPLNKLPGGKIADNKKWTKRVWLASGLPVAKDFIVTEKNYIERIRDNKISFPLVVKPMADSLKGYGVVTNIRSKKDLEKICQKLFKKNHPRLIIEEFYQNLIDYRVLVLNGKVIATSKRIPPYVVGDGKSTIKKLISEKNKIRKEFKEAELGAIKMDDEFRISLKNQKMTLNTVPKKNKYVKLKNVCNQGSGGEVEDATNDICKFNRKLAIKAAEALDLKLAGVDFLCKDISKPLKKRKGILLEVNEHPDLSLHIFPQKGKPRMVADQIIKEVLKLQ
ncbi:MAG: hypothetical protein ABID45_04705 [Patescibacteria group bacterium]